MTKAQKILSIVFITLITLTLVLIAIVVLNDSTQRNLPKILKGLVPVILGISGLFTPLLIIWARKVNLSSFVKTLVSILYVGIYILFIALLISTRVTPSSINQMNSTTNLQILDKEYDRGLEVAGWHKFRLTVKNNSDIAPINQACILPTFQFVFTDKNGSVVDTRDSDSTETIKPGETKTILLTVNTPLKELNSYIWSVTPLGCK